MLKKLGVFLLLILMLINIIACEDKKYVNIHTGYPWATERIITESLNDNKDISLSIIDDSDLSNKARLSIKNNSSENIWFGSKYSLQIVVNNEWHNILITKADFTTEQISVEPENEIEFEVDWSQIYGELPTGVYRIIKEYDIGQTTSFVYCTFTVL